MICVNPQSLLNHQIKSLPFLFAVMVGLQFIIITAFLVFSDVFKPLHSSFPGNKSLETCYQLTKHNTSAIILLWNPYFILSGVWLPSPSSFKCPFSDCIVTNNRKFLNLSSAIIFHWRNVDLSDLPKHRTRSQRWVLFNKEPPLRTPAQVLKGLSGKINWTVTYRKDSDVHAPYGWVRPRKIPIPTSTPPSDRKLACWLVSDCHTPSKRENFVKALKKFIPVDVYGKCGNLQCPVKDRFQCYKILSKTYKFYLAFENSICRGYATEKLFNALGTDMVPVVMGGENYSEILPAKSYIDALSFDGPKQLAEFLQDLDRDNNKYLSYLAWKKNYEVIDGAYRWICELCRKLHSSDSKIHGNLHHWWFQDANCLSWMQFLKSSFP